PVASVKFIKEQAYNKKASLIICITGVLGVFAAVKFFSGLSLEKIQWLVIIVIIYTSITMFRSGIKNKDKEKVN
ncbi:MAG: permease, partial [Clostridioides sp.]|nr:permease [Clostridioides sp.]